MSANVGLNPPMLEQDRRISEAYARERGRLAGFIRRRVPAPADVEDILQDRERRSFDAGLVGAAHANARSG